MKSVPAQGHNEFPMHRVDILNWVIALFFAGIAWLYYPIIIAKSVLIGGLVANISYFYLKKDLKDFLQGKLLHSGKVQSAKLKFYLKYYARLIALALVLYILVSRHIVHPLGLLMGLSVVVISIGITMASVVRKFYFTAKEA
ncbi:MAG: ATP synthase subunit I [Desulfobulbaceae bacterium]|nr:ATP synthase subunit I [Desulfobulbaceae bacterium]